MKFQISCFLDFYCDSQKEKYFPYFPKINPGQLPQQLLSRKHPSLRLFCKVTAIWLSHLSVKPTKWSNTFKLFVGKLPTNCLSVFDHFVGLALKGLTLYLKEDSVRNISQINWSWSQSKCRDKEINKLVSVLLAYQTFLNVLPATRYVYVWMLTVFFLNTNIVSENMAYNNF